MTEIEAAKYIIQHKRCNGITCTDCPAFRPKNGKNYCLHVRGGTFNIAGTAWFERWLSEHDKPQQPKTATRYDWSENNLKWFEVKIPVELCEVLGDIITKAQSFDTEGPKTEMRIMVTDDQRAEIEKIIGGEK